MDPGQILLSPAMNVNGPSELEALSPSFLMNQQNVMQPILQNSLPSNQETLPVGMYQNNLSPIPLTLPVSQFVNHNMQVPFYPFPVYMTNQSTSNQTAPGTSIQYATGTTNQGQMPRMIPNLQNIYQKDNQTRTMLKVPKQMPQFPNVYANIPTHNKFEVLPQDEDPLNECESDLNESDLNEVINPAEAEGLMDISSHTQKQKWCNASPGTSDVRQSRKQEIRAHTKAQVEIPEQEIFNNQVMLQVNNINEKFSGDYEISKFLKEKTKIKKFEFEINHDRTKMIMFLQNDEDAKECMQIDRVANVSVRTARKPKTCRGIIKGIPLYLTDEQIKESIDSPFPIIEVLRQKRYNREDKKLENSYSVLVEFESPFLPPNVWCSGRKKEVFIYNRRVLQCYKCQRYGHLQKDCRAKEFTCLRCSGNHFSKECSLKDKEINDPARQYCCANCKGRHSTTSSACPVRRENREILMVAEKYQMGYSRARVAYKSYAQVVQNEASRTLKPESIIVNRTMSQLRDEIVRNTTKTIVVGLLLSQDMLNIGSLPLDEKIRKLCNFVDTMKICKLEMKDIADVCQVEMMIGSAAPTQP